MDLLAAFWLRPTVMVLLAITTAEALVRMDGVVNLPEGIAAWVYAGGVAGARDVLGAIAAATIGVAGTTFSITVAALTLASNQMGPRLLRNFTRDPGNGYALGALLATFAYALVALRSVHEAEEGAFVPQLAVSFALILAFACVGVLIWFIHHIATSISVDRVVALVHADLADAIGVLPDAKDSPAATNAEPPGAGAALRAVEGGYLRVLDADALADWAATHDARIRLRIRPGDFIFPHSVIGEIWPEMEAAAAQKALSDTLVLGDTRSPAQDVEFLVRQLVEIGLRALSSGVKDPFTAIAVVDRLGAALCDMVGRRLPNGRVMREQRVRVERPATSYDGLVDAMFHSLRQGARADPAVTIRLLEVLAEVAALEPDGARLASLLRHADLARDSAPVEDASVVQAIAGRHAAVRDAVGTGQFRHRCGIR